MSVDLQEIKTGLAAWLGIPEDQIKVSFLERNLQYIEQPSGINIQLLNIDASEGEGIQGGLEQIHSLSNPYMRYTKNQRNIFVRTKEIGGLKTLFTQPLPIRSFSIDNPLSTRKVVSSATVGSVDPLPSRKSYKHHVFHAYRETFVPRKDTPNGHGLDYDSVRDSLKVDVKKLLELFAGLDGKPKEGCEKWAYIIFASWLRAFMNLVKFFTEFAFKWLSESAHYLCGLIDDKLAERGRYNRSPYSLGSLAWSALRVGVLFFECLFETLRLIVRTATSPKNSFERAVQFGNHYTIFGIRGGALLGALSVLCSLMWLACLCALTVGPLVAALSIPLGFSSQLTLLGSMPLFAKLAIPSLCLLKALGASSISAGAAAISTIASLTAVLGAGIWTGLKVSHPEGVRCCGKGYSH